MATSATTTPHTTPPTTSPPILVHTASPTPAPEPQLAAAPPPFPSQSQPRRSLGHRRREPATTGGEQRLGLAPTHAQLHLPETGASQQPPQQPGLPPQQQQQQQPQQQQQQQQAHHLGHRRGGQAAKPLFDWISRKLGARRASDAEHTRDAVPGASGSGSSGYWGRPSLSPAAEPRPPPASRAEARTARRELRRQLSPADIFGQTSFDSGTGTRAESLSLHSYAVSERRREANNPYPSLPIPLVRRSYPASTIDSSSMAPSASILSRSRTPSLASLSSLRRHRASGDGGSFSSSFRLAGRVADEDASVRPLPPSLATSPARSISILSRSGSMPLMRSESAPHAVPPAPHELDRRNTFSSSIGGGPDAPSSVSSEVSGDILSRVSREDSLTSTKPATTVISFESGNAPVAHIAVAPSLSSNSSPPAVGRSMSSPAGTSIANSANGGPTTLPSPISPTFLPGSVVNEEVQQHTVPRHTRYHPRNNPHPSAPPGPDASTLTLASSTFGFVSPQAMGARPGSLRLRDGASPSAYHAPVVSPSVAFADRPGSTHDRPLSNYDGLSSHAMSLSIRNRSYGRADDDASMRAIRRRGSWESGESRWSWRPGAEPAGVFAIGGARGRGELAEDDANRSSVYTHNSYRTPLAGIGGGIEDDEGGMTAITSESALGSHRAVSVVV
ncbi:uncharacterized protein LOC62_07G008997 [Vanrija pseudolonga]|uniref:Uncharacterized protein n=1 Tax=Vanrija pseudolonga TaxID=143232 RepID=A0AAF1BU22_9TREE|nr:hypothetical protein LOC62_07G008997 [Vanrija pseudolonga]